MKIEDQRKRDDGYLPLGDGPPFDFGDVVETDGGDVCLVVWSDREGRPYGTNPGYRGLMSLKSGHVYLRLDRTEFPKVRKLAAKLVIEAD